MLRKFGVFSILCIFVFVIVVPTSANPGVKTGTITGWLEFGDEFFYDDFVDVDSDIVAMWSIHNPLDKSGWFYGYNDTTDVAHVQGITDICEVTDASIYSYEDWSVGPVGVGDFVLFHNTVTGYVFKN